MFFRNEIIKILNKEKISPELLEVPLNSTMGDYALPCFHLAKKYKRAPQEIAKELQKKFKPNKFVKEIEANGPYLNFFIDTTKRNEKVIKQILKEKDKYGYKKKSKKNIVIEFPSPNTNKPLHLGHLRNMSLGESISRVYESQGFKVLRTNLNNDRGVHICKSMLAYEKWGKNKKPDKKTDHFVGDYYVLYSKKETTKLKEEVQELLRKWEANDKATIKLWKKMNKWALDGFDQTYKRLGIKFDKVYFESDTYTHGKEIVNYGLKKGFFKKDKTGAVLIDLGEKLGEKILLRADGTSVYITQDLYLAKNKYDDYKFSKSIYVVGNEQNYHFEVLFKILNLLKYKFAKNCFHLSFGMVSLPKGKMKSREGTIVDADNLMDDLSNLAKKEITSRQKLSKTELHETSEKIALAALKYYLLKYSAHKDFVFDPNKSISFEGDTGPYLQYSYVRAKKILKKVNIEPKTKDFDLLTKEEEIQLVKKLNEFPNILEKASNAGTPHIIAEYTNKLAATFNQFYEKSPILRAENKNIQNVRLLLVKSYIHVIKSSLYLLGINTVELM